MTGRDFVACAEEFAKGRTEAVLRSAVSRAYYGAFHEALALLHACGVWLPKTEQVHVKAGITEARQGIAAGRLRLQYGALGSWAADLAASLKSQFDAELVILSCFVTDESKSFMAGYNATIEAHIDSIWGEGSLAKVRADEQRRRKEAYDKWVLDRGMETG